MALPKYFEDLFLKYKEGNHSIRLVTVSGDKISGKVTEVLEDYLIIETDQTGHNVTGSSHAVVRRSSIEQIREVYLPIIDL